MEEFSKIYPAMNMLSMTVAPTAIPASSPTCAWPQIFVTLAKLDRLMYASISMYCVHVIT
jgi:hypothetical protein